MPGPHICTAPNFDESRDPQEPHVFRARLGANPLVSTTRSFTDWVGKPRTYGQSLRILIKYLRDHPESLQERTGLLVRDSHRAAFPCPAAITK